MNNKAFVICCKESNYIYECVDSIKKNHKDADIFIVDSCSDDKSYFTIENVTILDCCNKNYECGAYLYWNKNYGHLYDTVIFMQDSIKLNKPIKEIYELNKNTIFVFCEDYTGWNSGLYHRDYFFNLSPNFPKIDASKFLMTIWNSFIIKTEIFNKVISSDIFQTAKIPYDKVLSCAWERAWSIIFNSLGLNIKSIDNNQIKKTFGKRE